MTWWRILKASQYRKEQLAKKYGKKCVWCGDPIRINGEKTDHKLGTEHHIVYKSQGGTNDFENLCLMCLECQKIIHNEFTEDGICFTGRYTEGFGERVAELLRPVPQIKLKG